MIRDPVIQLTRLTPFSGSIDRLYLLPDRCREPQPVGTPAHEQPLDWVSNRELAGTLFMSSVARAERWAIRQKSLHWPPFFKRWIRLGQA